MHPLRKPKAQINSSSVSTNLGHCWNQPPTLINRRLLMIWGCVCICTHRDFPNVWTAKLGSQSNFATWTQLFKPPLAASQWYVLAEHQTWEQGQNMNLDTLIWVVDIPTGILTASQMPLPTDILGKSGLCPTLRKMRIVLSSDSSLYSRFKAV